MVRWIVESSLKLRFVVVTIAAAIIFFGADRLREMPVDILPEFAPPLVQIQTEALGLSAAEVEALITNPMEEFLAGVPWLETMRSKSVTGLSSIAPEPTSRSLTARPMTGRYSKSGLSTTAVAASSAVSTRSAARRHC